MSYQPVYTPQSVIGSVFTYPQANQSVSGTINIGVSSGSVVAQVSNFPTNQNVSGSVLTFPAANQSVSGTVSVGNFPTTQNVSGSVVATQGTNPWIETFSNSSILAVPVGSVITILQSPSIVGTYAEDVAHATADKGFFVLGVRNDTMSSITSADGDYTPMVQGPAGETIVANAPLTKWISAQASVFYGVIQPIVPAQGASVFAYITGLNISNQSANITRIRFTDAAAGATLGQVIVPANTGYSINMTNGWKTQANAAFSASVSGASSIYLNATGFISKI